MPIHHRPNERGLITAQRRARERDDAAENSKTRAPQSEGSASSAVERWLQSKAARQAVTPRSTTVEGAWQLVENGVWGFSAQTLQTDTKLQIEAEAAPHCSTPSGADKMTTMNDGASCTDARTSYDRS